MVLCVTEFEEGRSRNLSVGSRSVSGVRCPASRSPLTLRQSFTTVWLKEPSLSYAGFLAYRSALDDRRRAMLDLNGIDASPPNGDNVISGA